MKDYRKTKLACYLSFISQAITGNFPPLLYTMFHSQYGIPLGQIALVSSVYFFVQLFVDLLCVKVIDRLGQRKSVILAEGLSSLGLITLAILPDLFSKPFIGIIISVVFYSIGAGMIEIISNPVIESCPFENKEAELSMLHSFYCWGCVGVILFSTLFFALFGIENWKILAIIFAVEPAANIYNFMICPIEPPVKEGEGMTYSQLFKEKLFWITAFMMICAACSEMSISQWASVYVETALHISKTVGDIAGPCLFSVAMAICRTLFGKKGNENNLMAFMIFSTVLTIICYIILGFSNSSILGLAGCIVSGFSLGVLWPGTIMVASRNFRNGGTLLFAFLAMSGSVGGTIGPAIVGRISQNFGDNLQIGLRCSMVFPFIMLILLALVRKADRT